MKQGVERSARVHCNIRQVTCVALCTCPGFPHGQAMVVPMMTRAFRGVDGVSRVGESEKDAP